jgi:hypothetical protein
MKYLKLRLGPLAFVVRVGTFRTGGLWASRTCYLNAQRFSPGRVRARRASRTVAKWAGCRLRVY